MVDKRVSDIMVMVVVLVVELVLLHTKAHSGMVMSFLMLKDPTHAQEDM